MISATNDSIVQVPYNLYQHKETFHNKSILIQWTRRYLNNEKELHLIAWDNTYRFANPNPTANTRVYTYVRIYI